MYVKFPSLLPGKAKFHDLKTTSSTMVRLSFMYSKLLLLPGMAKLLVLKNYFFPLGRLSFMYSKLLLPPWDG